MMPANTEHGAAPQQHDAASNALTREQKMPPGETPVKQHNPHEQGVNPDQRGPAQPRNDDA